jgi:Flp pilus assembly protein TadD
MSTSKIRLDAKTVQLAIIVVLGVLIYANSLQVPFYLDDYRELVNSPLIKDFSYFTSYFFAGGIGALVSRSFGYLTFALNYHVGGLNVVGYHLVNIAIHLMAALLVYRLVSLTLLTPYFAPGRDRVTAGNRAGFIALLAALLFVAHPLQTQAVTYLIQRFASLAALLYLLSLTSYIRARILLNEPTKRLFAAGAWFTVAFVSALLAFMTKQNAFTLPFVVVLYEMMFFPHDKNKTIGILLGALVAGTTVIFVAAGKPMGTLIASIDRFTTAEPDISRLDYLATQIRVLVTYLRLLLVPVGQQLDYDYPVYTSFLNTDVLMSGVLLGILFAAAVYCLFLANRRECRYGDATPLFRVIAFGVFWFFITLSIESSIIPITDVIFEHRMYLPSVGIFMAVAAAVSLVSNGGALVSGWPRTPVLAVSAVVVLILGGMTIARNRVWGDEVSFWEDNASKSPLNGRVLNNLAMARIKKGDLAGAEQAYLRAIELKTYQDATYVNLGRIYMEWGRLDRALELFRAALSINPDLAEAHNCIGQVYASQNKIDDALQEFLLVVKLKPTLADAYNNIGSMYVRKKQYPEALEFFGKALKRNPDCVDAYINRGQLLLSLERRNDAIVDYRRALAADPTNATAAAQLRWLTGGQ